MIWALIIHIHVHMHMHMHVHVHVHMHTRVQAHTQTHTRTHTQGLICRILHVFMRETPDSTYRCVCVCARASGRMWVLAAQPAKHTTFDSQVLRSKT